MLVTLDMSQPEMSPVNFFTLLLHKRLISVTVEISQDPIGPRGPLEQSLDSFRQSLMAVWRSDLDFGAHPVVGFYYMCFAFFLGLDLG